jgi:hypothetical protein
MFGNGRRAIVALIAVLATAGGGLMSTGAQAATSTPRATISNPAVAERPAGSAMGRAKRVPRLTKTSSAASCYGPVPLSADGHNRLGHRLFTWHYTIYWCVNANDYITKLDRNEYFDNQAVGFTTQLDQDQPSEYCYSAPGYPCYDKEGYQLATVTPPSGGVDVEILGFGGGASISALYSHVTFDVLVTWDGYYYSKVNFG